MIDFRLVRAQGTGEDIIETSLHGRLLLSCSQFNKGSAFSERERHEFNLLGLLPPHVSLLDEQLARRYEEYRAKTSDLERHLFLRALQDRNEVLFYRLVRDHIVEMLPIIYTPVVGEACRHFSRIYHQSRGLFVAFPERDQIDSILNNRPFRNVDVIVVTDGERVLGIGDQGVGGMGIPVGKLSLYVLCAGIHPTRTLPIFLDVGTDNPERLADPLYLGWRHERIRGDEYDAFIERFVGAVTRHLPGALLQWEDFAQCNARPLLNRYQDRLCTFNDDIQGTGAVALAALLSALKRTGSPLSAQRIVIVGAGSAGMGIADLIVKAMMREGLTTAQARERFWFVDRHGLLQDDMKELDSCQRNYARPGGAGQTLLDVIQQARPTVLIGVSGQPGLFTEEIVSTMANLVERPIIFPLSNPTSRSEADPVFLIHWTQGRALVATGSPYRDVNWCGRSISISQCNNTYVFPGMGLGVLAAGATRITDDLFLAAATSLHEQAPPDALLPPLVEIGEVTCRVALAVGLEAQRQVLAPKTSKEELGTRIRARLWHPHYPRMLRARVADGEDF
jgi:malate dehydrogenase (oxaloacetate-decarboxylating)